MGSDGRGAHPRDFKGNAQTEKRVFDLPDLTAFLEKATTLAAVLDEFVTIKRHVALADWKAKRLVPPERRRLSGDTLLVRYVEADQGPDVAARGFVFGGHREPFIEGTLYTLDPDPNDWYGYFCSKVVEGLCAGHANTLYARLDRPEQARITWPLAAAEGQARFLAGLDACGTTATMSSARPARPSRTSRISSIAWSTPAPRWCRDVSLGHRVRMRRSGDMVPSAIGEAGERGVGEQQLRDSQR
jgi:hypothetical protein